MPRITKGHPDDTDSRNRLLQEAEKLFMAHGFAAVSTRAICEAAHVTQPSLYHYFGSKEGLYLAVVAGWFEEVRQGIEHAIAAGATLRDQLHRVALLFWSGAVGEYQAMQRDAMTYLSPEQRQTLGQTIMRCVIEPLVNLMRTGVAANELPDHLDPFVLTELFWAVLDGFSGIYMRGDPLPSAQENTAAIDFFLAGVRSVGAEAFAGWPHPGDRLKFFLDAQP
jgi:AcrR family transcriptional regulator